MKRSLYGWSILTLLAALLFGGCDDMHSQPSIKPQEAPRRSAPGEAVPLQGEYRVPIGQDLSNPVPDDDASRRRGEQLFTINCAMCHGTREIYLGLVGKHLSPPPPSLHDARIRSLSDADVFQRISFGFGRMPAFQQRLSLSERWDMVNYLHTFE